MNPRQLLSLGLLGGVLGASLLASQPARAQSELTCSAEGNAASVEPDMILNCLRAGREVNLDGVAVTGDLDLTDLFVNGQSPIISNALVIRNSRFTGSLTAFDGDAGTALVFQEQVDLRGSRFTGVVDFTGATFESFAHFENIRFESPANFTQAALRNGASFRGVTFEDSVSFMLARNYGGLDFTEAQFFGPANFPFMQSFQKPDALVQSDVSFSGAQFAGAVYFMNARFENQVHFDQAVFRPRVPGERANFSGLTFTTLNLTSANFERGQLDLNGTRYEKLIMPNFQPAILSPDSTEEALTALKDNFRKQGRLDIANEIAYWQYGIHRREELWLVQMLETTFLDWTFGYGLKPLHAVRTSIFLILFFAVFYYPEGVLRRAAFAPSKPKERKLTIRLAELPIAHDEDSAENHPSLPLPPQVARAWRAVMFSFSVFTKLSSGSDVAVRARSLVIAEWIIGLMMMAGFLFSLANTNPLLRSVLDLLK